MLPASMFYQQGKYGFNIKRKISIFLSIPGNCFSTHIIQLFYKKVNITRELILSYKSHMLLLYIRKYHDTDL